MKRLKPVFASAVLAALTAAALCAAPVYAADSQTDWIAKAKSEAFKYTAPAWRYVKKRFSVASSHVGKWWDDSVKKMGENPVTRKVLGGVSGVARKADDVSKKFNTGEASNPKMSVIHLKNGSAISCQILAEDSRHIVVLWEGGEVTFNRNEILSIEKNRSISEGDGIYIPSEKSGAVAGWQHVQNPVARLTNGQILDAKVSQVRNDVVLFKEILGSGSIDHEIKRDRIETFLFKPVQNKQSDKIGAELKTQFPKMKFYEDGIVTLITDSEGSSLKALRQAIGQTIAAVYLDFFELLAGREPGYQHYVVVFDKIEDYSAQATADGVPAEMCPGYFSPERKTLYMMNYFGDSFSALIYEVVSGTRDLLNEQGDALRAQYGDKYAAQIDGAVQDAKSKLENATSYIKGILTEITLVTLRHEVTHEMLHDWGVQTILVSKPRGGSTQIVPAASGDIEDKKKLVMAALGLGGDAAQPQIEAANSWFVEGVAEYAATSAVGRPNNMRLFDIKDARAKKQLLPLEHLTVYKMGSFPGVADKAMLSAYAQSWSLVEYLMKSHRPGFMKYLKRMATERPSGDDDLNWLLEATGQELRALESRWHAHIDTLPETEDPEIAQWIRVREILGIS